MKRGKNTVMDRIYDYLSKIYPESDLSILNHGVSAPYTMIKHSIDCQQIQITSFAESGKHYSGWYFMPLTFEAFEQRLTFNRDKLNYGVSKSKSH